jgi:phage terminase large subunit-like protein
VRLDRTLGPEVIAWIERELVHGPGDVQGQPIVLDDEQVAFILHAYAIDDHGKRVVRRGVYSRPKGRAKSELAAMLVCAEGLGPVRFGGWDAEGFPIAVPVTSPFIRCAATEEGQADNVYAGVVYMLREGAISTLEGLDVGITRIILPDGGEIVPVTARANSKDGGKETFAVFDETHLYVTPELRRLHSTIRRNLVKRRSAEPWALETSTMYAPGEESVAELSHTYAQRIAAGEVNDPGFLFDHRSAPALDTFDFFDDKQLRDALAQAYGEAVEWMDLDRMVAEARDPQTQRGDFVRFFLNLPISDESDRWITTERWGELEDAEGIVMEGTPASVCLGADGALTNDCSAVGTAWRLADGRIAVKAYIWSARIDVKAHKYVKGRIDNREMIPYVHEVAKESLVDEFVYDPRYLDTVAQLLEDDGFTTADAWSAGEHRAQAWQAWRDGIDNGTITHDGDANLAAHVCGATAKMTDLGWKVSKISQRHKIDALVACAMAHWRVSIGAGRASAWVDAW